MNKEQFKPNPEGPNTEKSGGSPKSGETKKQRTDTAFSQNVYEFFGHLRKENNQFAEQDKELPGHLQDSEAFENYLYILNQAERDLVKISYPKPVDPDDIAVGLGVLVGRLGQAEQARAENKEIDQDYNKARALFMRAGRKIWSEIDNVVPDTQSFAEILKQMGPLFEDEGDILMRAHKGDREFLKVIDEAIVKRTSYPAATAEQLFDRWDDSLARNVAKISEGIYQLELLRDNLRAKVYGREDVKAEETEKIDILRDDIEKDKPQEWLLEYKEKAHEAILEEFKNVLEKGGNAGKHLYQLIEFGMRPSFLKRLNQELSEKDFEEIIFMAVESREASKVAGKKIERPVFIVLDQEVYQKLEKVFFDDHIKSHGVKMSGRDFELPYYRDVGVIIANNHQETVSHEIRHSIDPWMDSDSRKGYDRVIEEAFAEYSIAIMQHKNWQEFKDFLLQYKKIYDRGAEQKIDQDLWVDVVDKVVEKIKQLQRDKGDLETQRLIIQQRTIQDLLNL